MNLDARRFHDAAPIREACRVCSPASSAPAAMRPERKSMAAGRRRANVHNMVSVRIGSRSDFTASGAPLQWEARYGFLIC